MTLTDEQLRSLRAASEKEIAFHQDHHDHNAAWWAHPLLALVDEVERLRGQTARLSAHLLERTQEVGWWRAGHDRAASERDALAAKAEAGKGLYEALSLALQHVGSSPLASPRAFARAREPFEAALARWEAANAE